MEPTASTRPRRLAADVDVLVVGAGITGIYQLYRAREAGFSVQLLEAGGGVGRHLVLEPLPRGPVRLGELHLRLPVLEGAVRRVGVAGALRGATGDRALPQPRRRPVRPPAPHAIRRHGHLGRVRRVVGDVDRGGRRRHRVPGAVLHRRDRRALGAVLPRRAGARATFAASQYHTGLWPATPVDFAGKRVAVIGTGSSGVQLIPAIADEVASLTVYQRTANWCTPLNNAPITPEEQAQLRADFEAMRETLNTSVARVPPPRARSRHLRRLRRGAAGVLREDVEQPRLLEAHQQLHRPAVRSRRERRVVRVHRREDPEHRQGSRDRGEADPEGPPLRREAAAVRDRLLRDVQQPERLARRSRGRRRSCA